MSHEINVLMRNCGFRSLAMAVLVADVAAIVAAGCSGQFPQFGSTSSGASQASASPVAASGASVSSASGLYHVTIGIRARVGRLGAVQFDVKSKVAGEWMGAGAKVACSDLAGASMKTCNNKGGGRLSCALINPNGMGTPTDLARCDFRSKQAIAASDFTVRVVDSSNTSMKRVAVDIVVTGVKPG